ncbi:MAG: M48 family metallopeptidase [Burkholderiaceae bacterium]
MSTTTSAGHAAGMAGLATPTPAYRRHAWAAVLALVAFLAGYMGLAGWFLFTAYKLSFGAHSGASSVWGWLVALCAAFLAVFMLKALVFVKPGQLGRTLELKRSEQPRLFEDLDRLADRAGAPRPHKVFVTPRVNASVFYDLSVLNLLFPSRKNLEIGLGLVNALSLGEFHAVLAHEFGHFAQRSMAVGRWAYVAQQIAAHLVARRDWLDEFLRGLSRVDFRIAWIGWVLSLIVWAIRSLVDLAFQGVELIQRALSREMELQADLVAVSLTGSDALIHALHKLQAADDSWARALDFVGAEHGRRRATRDAFAVQSQFLRRMREVLNDPGYHQVPPVPERAPESHRIFRADLAQPPQMWLTHPMNHEREANAKRRYVPVSIDDRSAWVLFDDAQALREQVTAQMINDDALELAGMDQTLAAVDEQFARETLHARYQGVYLGRALTRRFEHVHDMVDQGSTPDLAALDALYPASLRESMERWRGLERELAQLRALKAGHLKASGGTIRFRGEVLQPQDLQRVIDEVDAEHRAAEDQLLDHDRRCRSLHAALAREHASAEVPRLASLLALLHYAEHGDANLRDLQTVLAGTWRVESAAKRVGEKGVARLVNAGNALQDAMERLHRQAGEVVLDAALQKRLGVSTWLEVLGDFSLPTASAANLGEWLKVVDGWVNQFTGALGRLRSAALDELLATEGRVAAKARGDVIAPTPSDAKEDTAAPAVARVPLDYPTLLQGQERELQAKLGWWARFQSADGVVPALARLVVAGGIVAGVLGFSGSVGDAELTVYNGLATPVTVRIDGGEEVRLAPRSSRQLSVRPDSRYRIETHGADDQLIEAFDAEAPGTYGHYVYNVAGAAALLEWTATYGRQKPPADRPLGAPRWSESRADIFFAEPPRSVSSKGPTTRRVLAAQPGGPGRMLSSVKDDEERRGMALAHARWDSTGDRHAAEWIYAAARMPGLAELLAQRLQRTPNDVLLLRAEQDTAGDGRAAVCERHRARAEAAPEQSALRYVAARCIEDKSTRDQAFVDGHSRWPRDGWFAYAAAYTEAERGQWQAAITDLAFARQAVPALSEPSALDEARLRRFVDPASTQQLQALSRQSNALQVLLALEAGAGPDAAEVPAEYAELARGNLLAAERATAGQPERADRLRWLLAASDGAPAAWAERALGVTAPRGLDESTAFAAAGLAVRLGRDPAPYLAQAGLSDREGVRETMSRFVEALRRPGDTAAAERQLMQLPVPLRAQAACLGVVAWGPRAPKVWRLMAQRMLFAAERPYLAG